MAHEERHEYDHHDGHDEGRDDGHGHDGGSRKDEDGDKPDEKKEDAKPRSRLPLYILGGLALAGAVVGLVYWYSTRNQVGTDDAYTDGRAIMLAPQVSGYVTQLAATDNQFVHRGDLLVQIDPRPYLAARDRARADLDTARAQASAALLQVEIARKNFPAQLLQAQGQLQQAQGQLFEAKAEFDRQHRIARAATTQQAVDQSTANLELAQGRVKSAEAAVRQAEPVKQNIGRTTDQADQLRAQVAMADAQLRQAELNLGFTRIVAPQDGWLARRNVEMGNYLQAGTQIGLVVAPELWITANFKETQLTRMRPGQRVEIAVDAYPELHLKGHVDSVQLGSGSRFSAFPAENATGNFVKIVQRVPVKILIDEGLDPRLPVPLGLSVEPTVFVE